MPALLIKRTVLLTQWVLLTSLNFLLVVGGAHLAQNLRKNVLLAVFPLAFGLLYLGALLALGLTVVAGSAIVWLQLRVLRGKARV